MQNYQKEELDAAVKLIISTICNCEKMHPKFAEGTSQHSLLKNRIKALYIAKALIENKGEINTVSQSDLENALPPICSIISKTEKAQIKYAEDTVQYRRLIPMIGAMYIAKAYIENEMDRRLI